MSCQFKWNFNEYKTNNNEGDVTVVIATAPVSLSGVENDSVLYEVKPSVWIRMSVGYDIGFW